MLFTLISFLCLFVTYVVHRCFTRAMSKSGAKNILGLVFCLGLFSPPLLLSVTHKKKILIVSCDSGAGHRIASTALNEYLSEKYNCVIIDGLVEVLDKAINPFYTSSGVKGPTANDFFNTLQSNGWNRFLTFSFKQYAHPVLKKQWPALEKKAREVFEREKPDLIISAIPIINYPMAQAAKSLNLPYILTMLDSDYTMWKKGIERIDYDKFRVIVPFGVTETVTYPFEEPCFIAEKQRKQTFDWGMPLRKSFSDSFDKKAFKKKWEFDSRNPNILLMLGGKHSTVQLARFIRQFKMVSKPYHVFVFVGFNKDLGNKIKKMAKTSRAARFTIVPFTHDVACFMRTADLLISKPGGLTCAEILVSHIPTIFDNTARQIFWEEHNMKEVIKTGWGVSLTRFRMLEQVIDEMISTKKVRAHEFKDRQKLFKGRLLSLVESLIK